MHFGQPPRRKRGESTVAMINVVFLLLIFFLMTAQIAPPDPLEVALPEASGAPARDSTPALFLSRDGRIAYRDARGDAAIDAAIAEAHAASPARSRASDLVLELRADATTAGDDLAALLARLSERGVTRLDLVTRAP